MHIFRFIVYNHWDFYWFDCFDGLDVLGEFSISFSFVTGLTQIVQRDTQRINKAVKAYGNSVRKKERPKGQRAQKRNLEEQKRYECNTIQFFMGVN